MADTSTTDETVAAPSNGQAAPVTPITKDNNEGSDVEKVKAELQQQMRANQLAKEELARLKAEKEARDKADEEARAKKLEEENQYKELFEQEKAKREAIESEKAESERKATLNKLKSDALADYSDEVKALAEETGLTLSGDTDADITTFKEKLDKISKVVGTSRVSPNNPRPQTGEPELTPEQMRDVLHEDKDGKRFEEIIAKKPGLAFMLDPKN